MFAAVSVCLFVCLFVNTISSEWLNVAWWNLAIRCIVQKAGLSLNLGPKVKRSRLPGTKKQQNAAFCSGVVFWGVALVRHFFWSSPGGTVLYTGGKISACCLVWLIDCENTLSSCMMHLILCSLPDLAAMGWHCCCESVIMSMNEISST